MWCKREDEKHLGCNITVANIYGVVPLEQVNRFNCERWLTRLAGLNLRDRKVRKQDRDNTLGLGSKLAVNTAEGAGMEG